MKKILSVAVITMLLCSCGISQPDNSSTTKEMTLDEKIGQMLMVRCDTASPEAMMNIKPGGIVMFGVDFENLSEKEVIEKIKGFKEQSKIEPIIAVDEEGGTVVRVSSNPNLAPEKYQSPQYYYNLGGMEAVINNAEEKSELLKSLGITMNLAPVVDVSTNPDDFIYDRSLGLDAITTSEFASKVVTSMHTKNLMACLKHFPGYGSNVDTHTGIAIDNRPLSEFQANDFLPFISGIQSGAEAVLVSHNIVTSMDSSLPASISKSVHDILRNDLSFSGIIMTDDMSMDAMAEYENPYTKAVLAGNDMIIVTDYQSAFNEIRSAVENGDIDESVIDNAIDRIMKIKNK